MIRLIRSALIAGLLAVIPVAHAADIVWTNSNGGLWSGATNWSPNQLPGALDNVWITNAGTYTVTNAANSTINSLSLGNGVSGLQTLRLTGGTLTVTNSVGASNSVIVLAGGGLDTAGSFDSAGKISQSAGRWRLLSSATLGTYDLSAGELRGRNLTVTNLNWSGGDMNADVNGDKTIIPIGGVLNLTGTATRHLSYYSTRGRDLENNGTWYWTGSCILYGVGAAVINNYGTIHIASTNVAQFSYYSGQSAPTWNNHGLVTKGTGTNIFYFSGVYLNNYGALAIENGTLASWGSVLTNKAEAVIQLEPTGIFSSENGSIITLETNSAVLAAAENSIRFASGSAYLRTDSVAAPSILFSGATIYQETNNSVTTINQSAGVWRLNAPITAGTYNMTNGELRGASLTVNVFNWMGGALNSDGIGNDTVTVLANLNINGNTAKSLSYYSGPGRTLVNNGSGTWGGANITGQGGATIRNNSTLTLTNDSALQWGGTGARAVFHNNASFVKSGGNGTAYFSGAYTTNAGTFTIQSGNVRFGFDFIQTEGSASLGSNFIADAAVRINGGDLTGGGSIAGAFYNNGTVNAGTSPGLISAATFTNTPNGVLNVEIGGNIGGTNYDQIRMTGAATLNGTLNVEFVNGYTPLLGDAFRLLTFNNRTGTFAAINTPEDVELTSVYSTTNATLVVTGLTNAPLQILSAPTNVAVWEPDGAAFSIAVSGNTPISYQWQFNGDNIPGATNAGYSIPATSVANGGAYNVIVTDGTGAQTNASATLTVIPFNGTVYWTNLAGGNWSVAANWMPNRIPGATNTAVITSNGTYTVTVNSSLSVNNLIVGSIGAAGVPTLSLPSGNTLTLGNQLTIETNAVFALNGTLLAYGATVDVRGRIDWHTGVLSGLGRTVITNTGSIRWIGSLNTKLIRTNIVENYGTWTYTSDSFGNAQMPKFIGGAHVTNHVGGVINIGADGRIEYNSSQTPRSYMVNYGIINCQSGSASSPSYVTIDLLNYGTITSGFGSFARGTNYGTLQFNGCCLAQMNFFGDEANGEYFSFEPGTFLAGTRPNIAVAGLAVWNAPETIHNGILLVGSSSGGYSSEGTDVRVTSAYTNTYQVNVVRGKFAVQTNATADLALLTDSLVNGFWNYNIDNDGTIIADSVSHNQRSFQNDGLLVVRTNFVINAGSITGDGNIVFQQSATGDFSGGSIADQTIENYGLARVTAATPLVRSTLENKTGSTLTFVGGNLSTGPGSIVNFGAIGGYGSTSLPTTNYAEVMLDDSANRTLTFTRLTQAAGSTRINRGKLGGTIEILGGEIKGTNSVVGTLRNTAVFTPGNAFGNISITGNYTNEAGAIQNLLIRNIGSANYPQVNVGGTAYLDGTLNISFTNGYYPTFAHSFTVMTYTARSGVFSNIVAGDYDFDELYTPTNLILRSANALPSVSLSTPSTNPICVPFNISATASDIDGVITNVEFYAGETLLQSLTSPPYRIRVTNDFPGSILYSVKAYDDRGGTRTATGFTEMGRLPLLTLGFGGIEPDLRFKICMCGETNKNYQMLASTNLTTWDVVGPMTFTNDVWRYFDVAITNFPHRFFQAEEVP